MFDEKKKKSICRQFHFLDEIQMQSENYTHKHIRNTHIKATIIIKKE